MKNFRLLLCSLMLVATSVFAARDDMYQSKTNTFKEGKFWYKETCQKEYAGTMHNPPASVKNEYQYTLSHFSPTTGAPGSGDLTMCYAQLDQSSYEKLIDFADRGKNKDETIDQVMTMIRQEISQAEQDFKASKQKGMLEELQQVNVLMYALERLANQYKDQSTTKMSTICNMLILEGEALGKIKKEQ